MADQGGQALAFPLEVIGAGLFGLVVLVGLGIIVSIDVFFDIHGVCLCVCFIN